MGMTIVAVALLPTMAGTAAEIDKEVDAPLEKLYAHSPVAEDFSTIAEGILVFRDIPKAMMSFGNMQ